MEKQKNKVGRLEDWKFGLEGWKDGGSRAQIAPTRRVKGREHSSLLP